MRPLDFWYCSFNATISCPMSSLRESNGLASINVFAALNLMSIM